MLVAAIAAVPDLRGMVAATAAGDRETVRSALLDLGPFAPFVSLGLNVLQGILAPLPGFVVPYINGVIFGTWWGALLSWVGGIGAAAACFAISRTFGRGLAERLCRGHRMLERTNRLVERNGVGTVALARVLPGMPFDVFSYLGGITRIRFVPFLVGTAIGSAPHAYLYALMGDHLRVPMWIGVVAMPLLGLAVAGVHGLVRRLRRPIAVAGAAATGTA